MGLEVFESLLPHIKRTPPDPIFRDSYMFSMHGSKVVFVDCIQAGGALQYVGWKMFCKEFDEVHGRQHISYLKSREDKVEKQCNAVKKKRAALCTPS